MRWSTSCIFKDFDGPAAVRALLQEQCDDVIEQWTEVPILSHVLLKWEQENEEVSVFLYKMCRLQAHYMEG